MKICLDNIGLESGLSDSHSSSVSNNEFLAVLVLYNICLTESQSYQSINASLKEIGEQLDLVVYDNSEIPLFNESNYTKDSFNIHYVSDTNNSGISAAYNYAWKFAKRLNKKWLLLLDQDTSFPVEAMRIYFDQLNGTKYKIIVPVLRLHNKKLFSPSAIFFQKGFYMKTINPGRYELKRVFPVNSGCLINVEILDRVNGFNPDLKLDYIDFDFFIRVREYERFFLVLDLECMHEFSDDLRGIYAEKRRFSIFASDLSTLAHRDSLFSSINYLLIILLRAVKLTIKYKSFVFIGILFINTFKRRK